MPYISSESRDKFRPAFNELEFFDTSGELNYLIVGLIKEYLFNSSGGNYSYKELNDVLGVLECVKQEFYRRVVAPYEDKKIEENGDVYGR